MAGPTKRAAALVAEQINRKELELQPEADNEYEEEADSDYESADEPEEGSRRRKLGGKQGMLSGTDQYSSGLSASQKRRGDELFQQLRAKVHTPFAKAKDVLKTLYMEEFNEEPENAKKKKLKHAADWVDPLLYSYIKLNETDETQIMKRQQVSKEALSVARDCMRTFGTATVHEQVKFAGETIAVTKNVEKAKILEDERESQNKRGLDEMIEGISKKRGITTVEKSTYDWEKYKEEKNLKEELKDATKAGYVDKQDFLQRVDERQFEQERAARDRERAAREASGPKRPSAD